MCTGNLPPVLFLPTSQWRDLTSHNGHREVQPMAPCYLWKHSTVNGQQRLLQSTFTLVKDSESAGGRRLDSMTGSTFGPYPCYLQTLHQE